MKLSLKIIITLIMLITASSLYGCTPSDPESNPAPGTIEQNVDEGVEDLKDKLFKTKPETEENINENFLKPDKIDIDNK